MECNVKGLTVYYEVYGEGKPILLLHGSHVDHRLMKGCMEPVLGKKDGYKRIYIDLPGMGKTKAAEWITNSDEMLAVVLAFIEKILPIENFLLAGQSYGGYLARGVTHKMGNRIDGLFLLCPAIIANIKERDIPSHVILTKDDELLAELEVAQAKEFASMHVVQSREIWQRYRDEIVCGLKLADEPFLQKLQEQGYAFSFDPEDFEGPFTKPALVLAGRQDASVGYKDVWRIIDKYPRAAFVVLDKAGHHLQLEQADVFTCLVEEWLKRVEEG